MVRTDDLLVEQRGPILIVTINRPSVRNALDLPTCTAMAEALDELDARPDLAVGILTGAGSQFSSGLDLKAFLATGQLAEVPDRGLGFTRTPPRKPLIAAVEGMALAGGFELALACDLIVAAEDANFGLPEVKRGLVAGSGGLLRLPHRIPLAVAMDYALTGRLMPALVAHQWGLVSRLTGSGTALEAAVELATEIAANSPLALQVTKELIGRAGFPSASDTARQDELLQMVVDSEDAREGASAFAEKRIPVWKTTQNRGLNDQ